MAFAWAESFHLWKVFVLAAGQQICPFLRLVLQGLRVCAEPSQAQVQMVMYWVHFLVVACQGLKLDTQPEITANRYTVLASHGHHRSSIVLKNLDTNPLSILITLKTSASVYRRSQSEWQKAKAVSRLTDMPQARYLHGLQVQAVPT